MGHSVPTLCWHLCQQNSKCLSLCCQKGPEAPTPSSVVKRQGSDSILPEFGLHMKSEHVAPGRRSGEAFVVTEWETFAVTAGGVHGDCRKLDFSYGYRSHVFSNSATLNMQSIYKIQIFRVSWKNGEITWWTQMEYTSAIHPTLQRHTPHEASYPDDSAAQM